MANGYPNGWKDGWSSADHATESYSPYAWERAQRDSLASSAEISSEYEASLERERKYREKIEAERVKEEFVREQKERDRERNLKNKFRAIDIIVQQKKDEYMSKSWFGKSIARLKGKDFYKMQDKIYENAKSSVDLMDDEQIKDFIKKNEGRIR